MFIYRLKTLIKILFAFLFIYIPSNAPALSYDLPFFDDDLIGGIHIVQSHYGDTLYKIARRFEMGFFEMMKANPRISKYGRIKTNTGITIPSFFILPNAPKDGIVINLPEMRLYYYPRNGFEVITEPIAIGRLGWGTPEIATYVIEKIKDPIWVVPESIQLYSYEKNGDLLPDIMPPGPGNPLGQYALRLGVWSILIHGTNRPMSIGTRISSGCIRLYPEDIEYLFKEVDKDTPVHIVNQPYKAGWHKGSLYLEVHKPLIETEENQEIEQTKIYRLIMKKISFNRMHINWHIVAKSLFENNGIPHKINS